MIDFIKFEVLNKDKFEANLTNKTDFIFTTLFNRKTGKPMEYPKKAKLNNLDITITSKKAYISGSMHKFYNSLCELGSQNYNDFSFCEYKKSIETLFDYLLINPKDTKITNLEFGFNLEVLQNPSQIINNNLLMYNFFEPNRNSKFKGKGDFKEFVKSDYSIKVYNKSKQYNFKDKNILRIELKIIKSRFLENIGVCNFNDLNTLAFRKLFHKFMEHYYKLLIVDSISQCNRIRIEDESNYHLFTNPNYWNELRSNKPYNERAKITRLFSKIIKNNNLLKTKDLIRDLIANKFSLLMDCNYNEDLQLAD